VSGGAPLRPLRRKLLGLGAWGAWPALSTRISFAQSPSPLAVPVDRAESWPARPVRLVVPYGPGGPAGVLGRLTTQHFATVFGRPFVAEHRAGASGMVGSAHVARSEPDGYTLLMSGSGSHVLAPILEPAGYDPVQDFTHLGPLGGVPTVLAVSASFDATDVDGLLEQARRGARLNWGSVGPATYGFVIGAAMLSRVSAPNARHIGYRGGAEAMTDVASGSIEAALVALGGAMPFIRAGKVRALALSSERRASSLPEVPTFAEQGFPELTALTWFSLSAPARLPQAIAGALSAARQSLINDPSTRSVMQRESIEPGDTIGAAEFSGHLAREAGRWAPVLRAAAADGSLR
jgi:tripartite-type tricarboxylate transporter receptor subunit TctC